MAWVFYDEFALESCAWLASSLIVSRWLWSLQTLMEGSAFGTVFIDVVLAQPIPHLVCRQEVYFKNSVDWMLVRADVKDFNWNGIIRSPCPVLSLNEELLRVIRDRVLSGQLLLEQEISLSWMIGVAWLCKISREHIECGVVAGRRLIRRSTGWLVVVLNWSMKMLSKHSRNEENNSCRMHQIHGSSGLPLSLCLLYEP